MQINVFVIYSYIDYNGVTNLIIIDWLKGAQSQFWSNFMFISLLFAVL